MTLLSELKQNPLLNYQDFVPYQKIQAADIEPAVTAAIQESKNHLEQILSQLEAARKQPNMLNFDNTLFAFIEMEDIISRVWTPVENLLSLMGTQEIRDAANKARPLVVEFYNEYSLDPRVYELIKLYAQTDETKNLSGEKKRHLENTLIDFKLSGAELEGAAKEEFKALNLKLADLSQKFSENATDSKFELIITDRQDLSGLPEDIIKATEVQANDYREELSKKSSPEEALQKIPAGAWLFNLDYPSFGPFMKFSDKGNLRKILYTQYLSQGTKSSCKGILGDKDKETNLDNDPLIKEIFNAKLRKARLLGYKNYAELSLETKMAPSPEAVKAFLERLVSKAKPLAEKEYKALVEFQKEIGYKNTENNPERVYPWDKDYLSEKLRKAKFDFDTNITKPYFELRNTISGMLNIARQLFDIDFKPAPHIETWHKDVEPYQVTSKDGTIIGTFYMDLYPRDIKRQGAWVMPLVAACRNRDKSSTLAQCTLTCNLTKPSADRPSLLTHLEVVTLFHEFGHAMHHLLSKVELEPLSGTSVEWDFVELPSQLNENFCWEKTSLKTFAKHYKTGETIPDELIDRMLAARNFNEGISCIRQNEFGLFDLAVYMREQDDGKTANEIFKEVVRKYGIFEVWEETNFPCSFGHIFAGGYAAGYYSYKWAEVLEADAFSRFQNEGILNPKVGKEYREKILEKGDSEAPMKLFVDFMGREPNENALLKRMGLEEK